MSKTFNPGDHVTADFGDGPVLAHIVSGEKNGKYTVQKPDGSTADLAYREPADYDDGGSGGTFKAL
jgi:hypothetical protein